MNRLKASEARQIADQATLTDLNTVYAACEKTLDKIHADIRATANKRATKVEYHWDLPVGSIRKKESDLFPDNLHVLVVWDGGEGRADYPTETGKYIQHKLREDGYTVYMHSTGLIIEWNKPKS